MRTAHALVLALALSAAAAARAEWVRIDEARGVGWYVDPASISRGDEAFRVTILQDEAQQEGARVRSRVVTYDVDCAGERLRSVAVTEHAGPMARGETVGATQRRSEWLYVAPRTGTSIVPRSPYRTIVKHVCSR